MAFVIVEWEESGAISIINKEWLTPLKREAFWPPCKEQKTYYKMLKDNNTSIDDSWFIHKVKRCMFQTGMCLQLI